MSYWGKLLGGMAGFAMGGPFGAVVGAALGHAADQGVPRVSLGGAALNPARMAALLGQREQVFALAVVVLSAKLAKCDGAVTRAEIEEIRGAALAQATLDALLEAGLVTPRGHRETPGRPTLWGTTPRFLDQFGLKSLAELPRKEELVSQDLAVLELSPPA